MPMSWLYRRLLHDTRVDNSDTSLMATLSNWWLDCYTGWQQWHVSYGNLVQLLVRLLHGLTTVALLLREPCPAAGHTVTRVDNSGTSLTGTLSSCWSDCYTCWQQRHVSHGNLVKLLVRLLHVLTTAARLSQEPCQAAGQTVTRVDNRGTSLMATLSSSCHQHICRLKAYIVFTFFGLFPE